MIVVSEATGSELNAGRGMTQQTGTFLCASVSGGDQFRRELIERVRAYEFPNLFYAPKCTRPHFDEGFVRLDHVQAIDRQNLRDRRCRLSDEAMEFLRRFDEWLVHYTTGTLPEEPLVTLYQSELPSPA